MREMQARSAASRWSGLSPAERSAKMKALRAKGIKKPKRVARRSNIHNASKHELELLVKWGDPKFSVLAQAELKRRGIEAGPGVAAVAGNERQVEGTMPEATAAFPKGRWS